MATERYEIVRVKGSKPEKFQIVWFSAEGFVIQTSEAMSEAEWRAQFKKDGRSELEINSAMQRAREKEA